MLLPNLFHVRSVKFHHILNKVSQDLYTKNTDYFIENISAVRKKNIPVGEFIFYQILNKVSEDLNTKNRNYFIENKSAVRIKKNVPARNRLNRKTTPNRLFNK